MLGGDGVSGRDPETSGTKSEVNPMERSPLLKLLSPSLVVIYDVCRTPSDC